MRNPRNEARLGGKDFREFRDFKEFRERGMIQEPPSGLAGKGDGAGPSVMAPPYRGPGYVARRLSATGWDGYEKRGSINLLHSLFFMQAQITKN